MIRGPIIPSKWFNCYLTTVLLWLVRIRVATLHFIAATHADWWYDIEVVNPRLRENKRYSLSQVGNRLEVDAAYIAISFFFLPFTSYTCSLCFWRQPSRPPQSLLYTAPCRGFYLVLLAAHITNAVPDRLTARYSTRAFLMNFSERKRAPLP